MRKLFLTLTIPLFTMAIAPAIFNAPAQAETKTFNRPRTRSVDLDWCLTWDANCGEPAAKAFCWSKGFKLATDYDKTSRKVTRPIRDNFCKIGVNSDHYDGFSFIECSNTDDN